MVYSIMLHMHYSYSFHSFFLLSDYQKLLPLTREASLETNELTNTFGIEHRLTTAYHPQANGLDERYNQTLTNAISKFTQQSHENWDEKLEEIVYGYNSALQESSRYTPFEAMFGRLAKLPVDFNTSKNYDADEKLHKYLASGSPSEFESVAKRRRTETKIKAIA